MAEISATYVVVGGGIAGVSCAETLCHLTSDVGATILLVSGSELVRMAANVAQLTQTLVQFDVQESTGAELQDKTPGLKVITAVSITNFDPSNKKLLLSDGTSVR
jgi:NADPH-dependent 2,4-dienoyl-CoA reductase/sulfur reductase-like enzyme